MTNYLSAFTNTTVIASKKAVAQMSKPYVLLPSICIATLFAGLSLVLVHDVVTSQSNAESRAYGHAGKDQSGNWQVDANASKASKQATDANTSTNTNSSSATAQGKPSSTYTGIKYSISADPRSTAYSTAPPTPNPADFITNINHPNQVAPGTLIGYDAEKYGTKTYYGGDLLLSTSAVHINTKLTGPRSVTFTVSTPDGDQAVPPAMPWNDQSTVASPSYDATPTDGNSWTMFIYFYGTPTPSVTPFTLQLQTHRLNTGNDSWEYDGFLSVYIDG